MLWSWPAVLPLSVRGYDLQRLEWKEDRWPEQCETIDAPLIAYLRAHVEYMAPLGPLRLRTGAKLQRLSDPALFPAKPDSAAHPAGLHDLALAEAHAHLAARVAASPVAMSSTGATADAFIQELTVPVERAAVTATARAAVAIALSYGKAVASGSSGATATTITLEAPRIDTVVVYAIAATNIFICVFERPRADEAAWQRAVMVAQGVTLPIHEADPSLANPAQEYARAQARLVGGEALTQADFVRMAATLRPAAAVTAGRAGERISLMRADPAQSFEEIPFDMQVGALTLHPKARRVLGFGIADDNGLVPGHNYIYRLTGRFEVADGTDTIYDVHRIPTATTLPAAFAIRDLGLRFQLPVQVVLDPTPAATARNGASRRGILITTTGFDSSWLLPSYDGWSVLISLPFPVTKVILEVAPGHGFTYAAGLPWSFGAPPHVPLPPGPNVELSFGSPIMELRLAGKGVLFAVRIPSGQKGVVELHAYSQVVTFAAQPLPAAPLVLAAANLQQPPAIFTGTIDESTPVPERPHPGFKLTWLPAPTGAVSVWPDDLDAGPPLDGLAYQIEHRTVDPPSHFGPWQPIAADDNLTLGSRDMTATDLRLDYGCDLDALFPAHRPPSSQAGLAFYLRDVFGEPDPTTGKVLRPTPKFGTFHQYQIRAVDAAGRVSGTATLSNIVRLEKHIPPPLPTGPQPPPPLSATGHVTGPSGPRARAIVASAPGLTAADIALLGAYRNAILLQWGWRQAERDIDPETTEFRVYATAAPDTVYATITAVGSAPPHWNVAMTTSLPLVADELVGQWITCNGYPFRVAQNDAGSTPSVLLEVSQVQPATQPVTGPIVFGRPLQPDHQRGASWDHRVAVYPLTAADSYQHVFYDLLTLDPAHPSDGIWVGVSAADNQPYVADGRTTAPLANRPGNESAVAACSVLARYQGQPVFSVPPPLGDVPEIVTDEPSGQQVLVDLDLTSLLGGALPPGSPAALERCSADDILSRVRVSGTDVVLSVPDSGDQTIAFPNPTDHANVLAALTSSDPQRLANRYLLHLIAAAADPAPFFARPNADIVAVGQTSDRLPPKPGRFFYRVRAADTLGHLSAGGAILPVVVRVPSVAKAARPARRALTGAGSAIHLTVAVPADFDTNTALLFAVLSPPGTPPLSYPDAELLRMPNRRDLYPLNGLRLRLPDGTLLAPLVAKSLADPDVIVEVDGTRVATLTAPAAVGAWATVWCFALTRDGQPSFPCGPFGQGIVP